MPLVPIAPPEFDVDLALAYATSGNFTGAAVYRQASCYLHPEAAAGLRRAIAHAARLGLRLRIFDGFRPVEAQWVLWNHTPDPDFVADPRRGSPHSRGAAVDLTLIDRAGRPLEMGTDFDDFSPRAHHGSPDISQSAQRNRLILLGLMTSAGFDHYRLEWWHYQLFDSRRLPLMTDRAAGTGLMDAPSA
jgi:D-alanyl-D-alanine dipeptidase